jgi:hypothetical protein
MMKRKYTEKTNDETARKLSKCSIAERNSDIFPRQAGEIEKTLTQTNLL